MDVDVVVLVAGAVGLVVLTLLVVAIAIAAHRRRERRRALRERFGPEYDAVVDDLGRKRGHEELERRLAEHDELALERVAPDERSALSDRWRLVQHRFVETPGWSVREAEHLVVEVMRERGLPVDDSDSRVAALSVIDADLAAAYREAYGTFRSSEDGADDIGEMHHALLRYRDVFERLLDRPVREPSVVGAEPPRDA